MESKKIKTVYVVMHCIGETKEQLENEINAQHGFLWSVYFNEEEAINDASRMNSKFNKYVINGKMKFNQWTIIETHFA